MAQTGFYLGAKGTFLPIYFAASTAQFLRCYIDSNGYAAICDADKKSVGVATTGTPAWTGGHSQNTLQLNHQMGTQVMVANGAITNGQKVYAAASGKVSSTGRVCEGVALTTTTADGDYVIVLTSGGSQDIQYATVAASSAVTNTTAETSFSQTLSIPANSLTAGDVIEIFTQGIATSTNSTDTLTIKVKIGSTVLVSSGAVDVANNDVWVIDCRVCVRTAGASGTLVAGGIVALGTPAEATTVLEKAGGSFVASTTVDTTAAHTIDVTATWSALSASNSCRQDMFIVRRKNGASF